MELDAETGLALIRKARKQALDDRIWLQWAIQLPVMGLSGSFIGLKEYKDRVTGANIDTRPTAVIMAEVDDLEREFEEGGG